MDSLPVIETMGIYLASNKLYKNVDILSIFTSTLGHIDTLHTKPTV